MIYHTYCIRTQNVAPNQISNSRQLALVAVLRLRPVDTTIVHRENQNDELHHVQRAFVVYNKATRDLHANDHLPSLSACNQQTFVAPCRGQQTGLVVRKQRTCLKKRFLFLEIRLESTPSGCASCGRGRGAAAAAAAAAAC